MPQYFTSDATGRTFSIEDLRQPREFLWELLSYGSGDYLGGVDSYDHEPGVWQQGRTDGRWEAWTRHDRRGALPEAIMPDRFYLATNLRSVIQIGDYSGSIGRQIKVASQTFVTALMDAGQTNLQIMPLTVWRRPKSDRAPPPEEHSAFVAIYCWSDPKVFDLGQSSLTEVNFGKYDAALTDDGFGPSCLPRAYAGIWQHLELAVKTSDVTLPPMFRISGVGGRRYVSPQFVEMIVQRKMKVRLVKQPVDYDRETLIGEAFRRGALEEWPREHSLGS